MNPAITTLRQALIEILESGQLPKHLVSPARQALNDTDHLIQQQIDQAQTAKRVQVWLGPELRQLLNQRKALGTGGASSLLNELAARELTAREP